MAHNELLHEAVEVEGEDGEKTTACPLYPGLRCRDHLNAAVDVDNARAEGLVRVPFVELCPNTWLVLPTDEVVPVAEKDQFVPAAIQKQAKAVQARLGKSLPASTWAQVRPVLERAEAAVEEETWKTVLETLAGLEKLVPEPHPAFVRLLAPRLETVGEMVGFDAEDLLAEATPTAEQRAAAQALLAEVDVAVYGKHLPVRDALHAWLRQHPAE